MIREVWNNGTLIESYDDGESVPQEIDLATAIAEIRQQAARLSPTGATAIALNATADAIEALIA